MFSSALAPDTAPHVDGVVAWVSVPGRHRRTCTTPGSTMLSLAVEEARDVGSAAWGGFSYLSRLRRRIVSAACAGTMSEATCDSYRGAFGYVIGVLEDGEQIPLCRLRYSGSAHSFGFAIYSAAHDRYQEAVLLTGLATGTPQEALDTACTIHLAGLGT